MITGIQIFKEYFSDYSDQYVLIGGAACDLIFGEIGEDFRATKDLDLVLIVEALSPEFGRRFWDFVREGGYEHRSKSNGSPQFYRFDKPKRHEFPYMIELFSRAEGLLAEEQACAPLHLDDELSSLSAILLNDAYYDLLRTGKKVLNDVPILSEEYLIVFKAKAWLDLSMRKQRGEHVDGRDIKKHRNDIVRLAVLLTGQESVVLSDAIREDMAAFISAFEMDPVDPAALKIKHISSQDIIDILKAVYLEG